MPPRPRKTPLVRSIAREIRSTTNEQPAYYRLMNRALTKAKRAAATPSVGRISAAEKKAVRNIGKASRLVQTPGEARDAKAAARRKARRS